MLKFKDMYKGLIGLLVVGILLFAGAAFLSYTDPKLESESAEEPTGKTEISGQEWAIWRDETIGLELSYPQGPDGYILITPDVSGDISDNAPVRIISVMNTKAYEEALNYSEAREGPPAITAEIYSPGPNYTPNDWITANPRSNYQQGVELKNVTVAGYPAVRYEWDGLYRGENVVTAWKGWVYVFSVSYPDKDTQINRDFDQILETVKIFAIASPAL